MGIRNPDVVSSDGSVSIHDTGARPKQSVYFFVKYYPNPFKPFLETQLAQLIRDGHSVRLFALGTWNLPQSDKAQAHGFARLLTYLPSTARSALRMIPAALRNLVRTPQARSSRARRVWRRRKRIKQRLLDVQRTLLMPLAAPDICLVHDLATLRYLTFLRTAYPSTRVALYFHGGDIPMGDVVDDRSARDAFSSAHVVFTNTSYSQALAVRRGCPPEKIVRVPVGFDLAEYIPERDKSYATAGLRVLFVGRLSQEKGVEYLLHGFETFIHQHRNRAELRVIGYGPLDEQLRRASRGECCARIRFLGELPHSRVREELRSADVVVVPSIPFNRGDTVQEETQATVVQEALLMKVLVVATRTGGILEGLPSEMHQFSVPPADASAIAARLAQIAHMPHDDLVRFGELGRRFVVQRYDVARLNQEIIASTLSTSADGA